MTRGIHPTPEEIRNAGELIRQGGLVAFPTETVYGLGADATSDDAINAVFDAKGRPRTDPLIVHVSSVTAANEVGDMGAPDSVAHRLAERFWPGPLSLILNRREGISDLVGGGFGTVGVRCPAHPVALDLLDAAGVPLAAPSANRFGRVSPTDAGHVRDELGDSVDLLLDAGPTPLGIESTVVDCTQNPPAVLRPGALALEDIEDLLGEVTHSDRRATAPEESSTSPGTLAAHYSPLMPVVLVEGESALRDSVRAALGEQQVRAGLLELPSDPGEAAASLFALLRRADEESTDVLLAQTVDPAGVGRAINDRLFRAAHGHLVLDDGESTIMGIVARVS